MVTKTKPRLAICICLLVVLLAFIWGNSMTPGNVSGEMSGWVSRLIGKLLPFLSPESEHGHWIVRKIAHFSEFAVLGALFTWLFAMLMDRKFLLIFLPLGCGMVCAIIDECIQLFSPGRVCSFFDMCIDWSGVLTGLLPMMLTCLFIGRKRRKK